MAHSPTAAAPAAAVLQEFDAQGFVRLPGLLPQAEVERWRRAIAELAGTGAGSATPGGTLQIGELSSRPELNWALERPEILTVVRHHLGDDYSLNEGVCRAPAPGHGAQALHVDWMGPVPAGDWHVCNALIALVDIGPEDGATRIVPGSHQSPDWEFRALSPEVTHTGEVRLTLRAGDAAVFSGHLLHAGSENHGSGPRYALLLTYRVTGQSPPG